MTETTFPYDTAPQTDGDAQYRRLFEAAGCRTQTELAAILEIKQSAVSDAKRRKSVPADWLVKLFEKKRVNPEWVRTGLGNRTVCRPGGEADPPAVVNIIERRPAHKCTTDELLAELARRALKLIG